MFPPSNLICIVTTASPIQMSAKTPEKTTLFCSLFAVIERSKLSNRQNINGPLIRSVSNFTSGRIGHMPYHRSQSRKPSLIPPCNTASASGHLPAMPLKPPAMLLPSPRSAPPIPPPRCNIPPRRYLGHKTCRIFSHTACRSLDNVSHTVSSIVFVGARLSSPGIEEFRYDWEMGLREDEDCILPVKGARSEVGSRGSSSSFMLACFHSQFQE